MKRLVVASMLAAGCSSSSLAGSPLSLQSVEPATVSARGGETIRLSGHGFGDGAEVLVHGQKLAANVVDATTIEATTLPDVAGRFDVEVTQGDESATLDQGLTVTPIPLAFADAPAWTLPTLPGPITALGRSAAGPLVAGPWGMNLVVASSGDVHALPVAALAGDDASGMPPVLALATSTSGGKVAACVDAAPGLRWLKVEAGALAKTDADDPGGPCAALAIGDDGGTYALVATDAGLVVKGWRAGSPPSPMTLSTPPLPPTVDAFAAVDLDGDGTDELVVAGTDGTTPTVEAWRRVDGADGTFTFVDEGGLPARDGRTFVLLPGAFGGEGPNDLFAGGEGADSLYLNDGHGHFVDDAFRRLPFDRATSRGAAAGDLDRDGALDLVVATPAGADRLYVANGAGFDDQTAALGLDPTLGANAVVLDDLDRDGDLDVVSVVAATGALRVRWLVPPP